MVDASVVRKAIEINPKLLALCKEISGQTGLSLDNLVNLALYEMARRLGYVSPQARAVPAPPGIDLLDRAEPAPRPRRKASQGASIGRVAPQRPAKKAAQDILYFQLDDGPMNPIRKDVFLIGRGSKCDCVIQHRSVSREHAVITKERGGWFIEDLNSANGTWFNGEQIGKHKLTGGEELQISNYRLRFSVRPG
jgi:hypothetical protein